MKFTHGGWFWLCPILYVEDGCGAPPRVVARWSWLEWLFTACTLLEEIRISVSIFLDPEYEPSFMFKVKPLEKAIELEMSDEQCDGE